VRQWKASSSTCTDGTNSNPPIPPAANAMPIAVAILARYQRVSSADAGTIPSRPTPRPIIPPMKT
jgi:hypothetical protein